MKDRRFDGSTLFDKIPGNFFSVLAGPLKDVHAGLLFLVYDQYRRTIYTLPRETIIDLFCEYLEGVELTRWEIDGDGLNGNAFAAGSVGVADMPGYKSGEETGHYIPGLSGGPGDSGGSTGGDATAGDGASGSAAKEATSHDSPFAPQLVRDRANMMFRKFVDTGWLLQEQHYDYSFKVTLPDYALAVLETLEKINTGYRMEFQGKVLSIYQNLTGEEGASYLALEQAKEYTGELIDGLKRLSHSIRGYTEKLLKKKDPREIMAHIFDEYQVEVLGEQYYRLKTSEHISKYRTGILKEIKSWQINREGIVAEASRMVLQRQAPDHQTSENTIYEWLDYIDESFRGMDGLLDEIDRRNAQYARSAVEKLRFQLQQGRGIEQSLISLLGSLSGIAQKKGEHEEVFHEVNRRINLFPQRVVDEFSIRTPARIEKVHKPKPSKPAEISPEVRRAKLERFRRRVRDEINVDDINSYVVDLLQDREQFPISELPARTKDEWVRLIYIILFSSSRRSGYRLAGERGETVKTAGGAAAVPALFIERK